jgi:sugar/nucleoside kinase (ribokinase family)
MSIVVVGSIAFDTVTTPFGNRDKSLGGAASYFAIAAQFFSKVKMVGIIGDDFPSEFLDDLRARKIDISGIERVKGKSFHWFGEYGYDLNEAKTLTTELNVFEHFLPNLPDNYRTADTIFLANIDPDLQIHVLKQMKEPKLRALDSMNFWIERKNAALKKAIGLIDILFVNDAEARALTGEHNIIKAARAALRLGARIVVIKRGEYGALLCFDNEIAFMPAYPLEDVFDPTGAGDSFAGGFLGYLSEKRSLDLNNLKHAMLMGTVMSSFVIEKFSFDRLLELDEKAIAERRKEILAISQIIGSAPAPA